MKRYFSNLLLGVIITTVVSFTVLSAAEGFNNFQRWIDSTTKK